MPSLWQSSTVDFVTVYDPRRHTENPTGRTETNPAADAAAGAMPIL